MEEVCTASLNRSGRSFYGAYLLKPPIHRKCSQPGSFELDISSTFPFSISAFQRIAERLRLVPTSAPPAVPSRPVVGLVGRLQHRDYRIRYDVALDPCTSVQKRSSSFLFYSVKRHMPRASSLSTEKRAPILDA